MKSFKDGEGREWVLSVNVSSIQHVRDDLKVDLLQVADGKLIERFMSDPILVGDIAWCLCREQAEGRNITETQFASAMGGDAIEQALTALLEEIIDFFPSRKRDVLRKAFARLTALQDELIDIAEARIDSKELDDEIGQALASLAKGLYGKGVSE